jgi:two-component system phosphate regulon sensor histidine kinase PhoR
VSRRRRIRTIIYPRLALLVVLVTFVFVIVTSEVSKQYMLRQSEDNLTETSLIIENLIKEQNGLDVPLLQQQLSALVADSHTRITIIDGDGTVLIDTDASPEQLDNHGGRPEILKAFRGDANAEVRFSDTVKQDLLYYAKMMKIGASEYVLRVAMPYTQVQGAITTMYWFTGLGALMFILFSLLTFYLLDRIVERPLKHLADTAASYAELDFSMSEVPQGQAQEIQSVYRAMRRMAKKIGLQLAELHQQRDALQSVLDGMKESVFVLDQHGIITQANPAAAALFSASGRSEDLKGKFYLQVLRNNRLQRHVEQALDERDPVRETDLNIEINSMFFQVYLSQLSELEERKLLLLVLNDITELMRLERIRRDFVANVSHELKTPVTSIKGFTETLLYSIDAHDIELQKRFLTIINTQTSRLEAIIDDLLTLSKLEQNGGRQANFSEIELQPIIEEAVGVCLGKHAEHEREVTIETEGCPPIKGNALLIEQALINLVDNAMKYSEPDKEILISCSEQDEHIHLSVTDKGYGIPEKDMDRIFERFYRIDKGRSREKGGTGLGLSIVKHIASQHGGSVTVASTEGEGTTFTLLLPMERSLQTESDEQKRQR